MSYIGVQPAAGQYRRLDDISGSFNGSTTTFTTSVGGENVTAGSAQQLLVSVDGVIQNPGTDYSVSTYSITFTTAPASGLDFFAILMGDAVNIGVPGDNTVTSAKIVDGTIVNADINASAAIAFSKLATDVAGTTATQTFTNKTLTDPAIIGTILEDVYTISDGAAFEVDPSNGSVQLITLGANRTPKATNFAAGESITLMVDDGTAYTLTWTDATWGSGGVSWTGGSAPTLATSGYTVLQFWKVGTQVYGALVGEVA